MAQSPSLQNRDSNLHQPPEPAIPATPELAHAALPDLVNESIPFKESNTQEGQLDRLAASMTPPPSSQVPGSPQIKTRTPSPIDMISQISTPPPTIEGPNATQSSCVTTDALQSEVISAHDIATASADELRKIVGELQSALRGAKMSAAHHKLQYQMLAQESNAALERMIVEAQMTQCENQIIYNAGQARAAAAPVSQPPAHEGTIPIQKDLYNRMIREIQLLGEAHGELEGEIEQQQDIIKRQDLEIASLSDKVTMMRDLMRERTREAREPSAAQKRSSRAAAHLNSAYSTPVKAHLASREPAQPFAALLQASEMASQDAARSLSGRGQSSKRGHARNAHSQSYIPTTPQSARSQQNHYRTPQGRQPAFRVPATAPIPRTSAVNLPNVYDLSPLPFPAQRRAPTSEGTVSASENNDDDVDSEADTEIIDQDEADEVLESQASRAASQLLRSSEEQTAKRESFKGSGMLPPASHPGGDRYRQTKLFGTIRKANVDRRDEERPAKRTRTEPSKAPVGLGIVGLRD